MTFTSEEKTFLVELYESFWWGGMAKGMPEAGKLADQFVNGKGKTVQMDVTPYR
jgi:hypothetical protein